MPNHPPNSACLSPDSGGEGWWRPLTGRATLAVCVLGLLLVDVVETALGVPPGHFVLAAGALLGIGFLAGYGALILLRLRAEPVIIATLSMGLGLLLMGLAQRLCWAPEKLPVALGVLGGLALVGLPQLLRRLREHWRDPVADVTPMLLLSVGAVVLIGGLNVMPNGVVTANGAFYGHKAGMDGLGSVCWILSARHGFPELSYLFAGIPTPYQWGSACVYAFWSRLVPSVDLLQLVFQVSPPFLYAFIALAGWTAAASFLPDRRARVLAAPLVVMGGNLGCLPGLLSSLKSLSALHVDWELFFSSPVQMAMFGAGPSYSAPLGAAGVCLTLAAWQRFVAGHSRRWFAVFLACAAATVLTKSFYAIVLTAALGLVVIFLWRHREWRWRSVLCGVAGALVCGLALWGPGARLHASGGSAGFPVVAGLNPFPLSLLSKLHLASEETVTQLQAHWTTPPALALYALCLLLTIIGANGFRLAAFGALSRRFPRSPAYYLIWAVVVCGTVIGNAFVLRVYPRDTLQFYLTTMYVLPLLAVPVLLAVWDRLTTRRVRAVFAGLLFVLCFATTLQFVLLDQLVVAWISPERLAAAEFLRSHAEADDVLLHNDFDVPFYDRGGGRPTPRHGYGEQNYFYPAYTRLQVYYEPWKRFAQAQVDAIPARRAVAEAVVDGSDRRRAELALRGQNIQWVWVEKRYGPLRYDPSDFLRRVLDNPDVALYQVIMPSRGEGS